MAPKNTIWCTAMPRARMKLGRIICTEVPLLAITVIQQAPVTAMQTPKTTGVMTSAAISVAAACMPIAQMLARSAPSRRLTVGIDDGAGHRADAEHGVEDAEGELVEPELEAADHRQQRADGDARHEEAEAAGEHRLELARAAHEGDAGARRLDEALAALRGARLGRAASSPHRQDDADVGDRR